VGLQDVFVLGCEATGMPTWAVGFGSPEDDYVYAVAAAGDGSAFIGGEFEGAMTIAGTTLRSIEGSDMFVVELNGSTGAPVWAASRGKAGRDYVLDALADSMGNVLVVGWDVPPTRFSGASGMPAMSFELLPDNHAYALARTADGQGVLLGGNGWLGALK
jgi:hypothetical protein